MGFTIFSWFTIKAAIGAPYVPTPMAAVKKMVKAAKIRKGDRIYDIGCGDGRVLYLAEKNGAQATGFEISPAIYLLALIKKILKGAKMKIRFSDFRNNNLGDADVIFCYLMPNMIKKNIQKFQKELKPGTKIISYAFRIWDWKETEKIPKEPEKNIAPIWIY